MRILFVYRHLDGASAEAAEIREMIYALCTLGISVGGLFVSDKPNPMPKTESAQIFSIKPGARGMGDEIRRVIKSFQPDVAHIKQLWIPFHAYAGHILRRLKVPYIVEPGGHLNPYNLRNRYEGRKMSLHNKVGRLAYHYLIDRPLCRKAVTLRTLSPWERAATGRIGTWEPWVIPMGFNDEWLTPEQIALERHVRKGPLRANYLGRLDIGQKGLDLVLDAMALLKKQGRDSEFAIRLVGPDVRGSTERLRQMISERDLSNVTLEGPMYGNEKAEFFRQTDLFLHASRMEETAKLAREAVAAGVPILATRESNFGDWVDVEGSGRVIELRPESIAAQLCVCATEPKLLDQMAGRTLPHARKYSWGMVAGQLINMYRQAANSRS